MSDKVQLIYNKIENRIDEICDDGFVLKENQQEYETLTDLEDFIDSLPEESVSEDLEEHYTKEFLPKEWFAKPGHRTISEFNLFTAQYFAKWQHGKDFDDLLQSEMKFPKEFYEKGRFDMRDEMMKDAVGGEYWNGSIYLDDRPTEYKDGDKMKIIIIKEEQE